MTNRLELNWKLDGFVDEQRYYCSETPIDPDDLPVPKATLVGDVRNHADYTCDLGKKYYVRVSAVKNGLEKFSDEKLMLFGKVWTPLHLSNLPKFFGNSDNVIKDSSNSLSRLIDLSGNNNHFDQSSNTLKPVATNGVIRFDGLDDYLKCVNRSLFNNIPSAWVFAVYKKRSISVPTDAGTCVFYVPADQTNSNRFNLLSKRYSTGLTSFAARTLITDTTSIIGSSAVRDGSFMFAYAEAKYSSGTTRLRTNCFDDATGTITAKNTSNIDAPDIYIGSGGLVGYADLDVYALILGTGSTPTLSELQKLEGWAAHKYGLTDNLPIDHPYKTLVPTL